MRKGFSKGYGWQIHKSRHYLAQGLQAGFLGVYDPACWFIINIVVGFGY